MNPGSSLALTCRRDFFPVILNFLRQLPFIGTFLSLPYIRGVSPHNPACHSETDRIGGSLVDGRPGGGRKTECGVRWMEERDDVYRPRSNLAATRI